MTRLNFLGAKTADETVDSELIANPDKSIVAGPDKLNHIFIEGENLEALKALLDSGVQVDFIYIDPPYNTGTKNFIYQDKFPEDAWLSFMSQRLNLAKSLLKDDGVIAVSIDENEVAELKLLLSDIFGKNNFLNVILWTTNPSGRAGEKFLAKTHEYVILFAKDKTKVKFQTKPQSLANFRAVDADGRYYHWASLSHKLTYSKTLDYELAAPDGTALYPGYVDKKTWETRKANPAKRKDYCWRWTKDKVAAGVLDGTIRFRKNADGQWRVDLKTYALYDAIHGFNQGHGTFSCNYTTETSKDGPKQLSAVIGRQTIFSYPKPTGLIKYILNLKASTEPMTVLDFFAGSGTTGQAVLELNVINGTKHRFILCTNNENGICENVCYPRLKTLLTGKKQSGEAYDTPFKDFITRQELQQTNGKIKCLNVRKTYDYRVEDFAGNLTYYTVALKKDA